MKVAGIVTLYYPDGDVLENIESYLSEIDQLYVIDNTPEKENKEVLPND